VLVKKLLEAAALGGGSFDDVVQAYLAARALAADLNGISQAEPLRAALAELGRFLGRECFGTAAGNRPPSAYDSPQQLDRAALARHVQAVATALAAIQQP
jgi:hypothetical protein